MTDIVELIELPPKETALAVYQMPSGLDPWLQKIRDEVCGHAPDVATRKGRESIASLAYKVRQSKTALDKLGKDLVDELKDVPKRVDAERKRMRDTLDALADEVRAPLTAWEQSEEDRINHHKAGIEWFRLRADENRDLDAAELRASLFEVETKVVDISWEEFETEAHRIKARALDSLAVALATREKIDAEQAELARLRAEAAARELQDREDRIAREAAERAQREAEEKAHAEREAAIRREQQAKADAERREMELKLAAENAEREKVEAQARAEQAQHEAEERAQQAAEAERQRIAAERAAEEAATRKREADKTHRAAINRAALDAFVAGGMTEDCAKQAITLIVKGSIPAIKIQY